MRLDPSNENIEKTKATKKARLENLQMNMVELNHGAKSNFLSEACKVIGVTGDNIKGKPEKVLTVGISTSGAVSFRVSIPGSETKGLISLLQELRPGNQPPINVDELP